ncbi:MAG TPA: tripartite tricarboxylate transporter substrate-binding protein, partial [Burkholderiaceae bacterium]
VFAPAGTPAPIVARLSSEIRTIVQTEAYRRKMDEQGAFAAYMDSQTLAKFVDKELAAWADVIKTAGIKVD